MVFVCYRSLPIRPLRAFRSLTSLPPTRLTATAALAVLALLIVPGTAGAQGSYPNKPVRLIVAYAAGGVADVIARIVMTPVGAELGQSFVIDNRPGAGGAIGTRACASSTPDGYTLCMGSQSSIILNPMLFKEASYDPVRSFTPITLIGYAPNVLVVSPKLGVRSVDDLMKWLKAHPGAAWGTSGVGTSNHLTAIYLNKAFGLRIEHVPYKGGVLAVQDVLGGQIPMAMDQISSSIAHVRKGTLAAILQSGLARSPYLPDVPTFAETVFPKFRFDSFQALIGPAGMPPEIVKRLNAAIKRVLTTQAGVVEKLQEIGVVPVGNSPEEFAQQIRSQVPLFRELMDMSGLKPE